MTTQAIDPIVMFCGCDANVRSIGMRQFIGEEGGETQGDFINEFPVMVYSVNGNYLGFAQDKQAFIDLWNSDPDNNAVGTLADGIGAASFNLLNLDAGDILPFLYARTADFVARIGLTTGITISNIEVDGDDATTVVSWGDGTFDSYDGSGFVADHNYEVGNRIFPIKIFTGIGSNLTALDMSGVSLKSFSANKIPDTLAGLTLANNQLTELDITFPVALVFLDVSNNAMSAEELSGQLIKLDELGGTDGTYNGGNQVPPVDELTTDGDAAASNLTGKGWTVDTSNA